MERLSSVPVVLHRRGSAPCSTAAEFAIRLLPFLSSLPIGAGESASRTSGSNPLQSEVHFKVRSNFAVVQDVAQLAAKPSAQSSAQLSLQHPAVQQPVSSSSP